MAVTSKGPFVDMPRNRQHKTSPGYGGADQPRPGPRGTQARSTFSEWIAADGAPGRPFDDKGVLVASRPARPKARPARTEL